LNTRVAVAAPGANGVGSPWAHAGNSSPYQGDNGCPLSPPGNSKSPGACGCGETTMRMEAPKCGAWTRGMLLSPGKGVGGMFNQRPSGPSAAARG